MSRRNSRDWVGEGGTSLGSSSRGSGHRACRCREEGCGFCYTSLSPSPERRLSPVCCQSGKKKITIKQNINSKGYILLLGSPPGHSHIFLHCCRVLLKMWEWPGDEANIMHLVTKTSSVQHACTMYMYNVHVHVYVHVHVRVHMLCIEIIIFACAILTAQLTCHGNSH